MSAQILAQKEFKTLLREHFTYRDGSLYWIKPRANRTKIGDRAGTPLPDGYIMAYFFNKPYLLHRLIFLYHNGYTPKYIDHINRDKTDNRIENLRPATCSQNGMNSNTKKNNTSGFKGVSFHKVTGKYSATISLDGRSKHLGLFDTPKKASAMYCKTATKYYGEFAHHENTTGAIK